MHGGHFVLSVPAKARPLGSGQSGRCSQRTSFKNPLTSRCFLNRFPRTPLFSVTRVIVRSALEHSVRVENILITYLCCYTLRGRVNVPETSERGRGCGVCGGGVSSIVQAAGLCQ